MKVGDSKSMEDLLSKEMIADNSTDAKVKNIGHQMVADSFTRVEEYYVVNKYIEKDTINTEVKGINAHKLIYPADGEEMYIVFYMPQRKDLPNKQMITAVYAKLSYGWKLTFLELQPYTLNGKTAPELFKSAQQHYANHHLIDAVNNTTLAITCLNPSGIWKYDKDDEVRQFYYKVLNEAAKIYKFPTVITQVSTRPGIIGFFNKTTAEGNFPIVSYLTKIKLRDTAAVRNENLQIRKAIGTLMPGLDKNNKYIYYMAYNEQPTYSKQMPHFDMVDKRW